MDTLAVWRSDAEVFTGTDREVPELTILVVVGEDPVEVVAAIDSLRVTA
jgi:hypothetical protein